MKQCILWALIVAMAVGVMMIVASPGTADETPVMQAQFGSAASASARQHSLSALQRSGLLPQNAGDDDIADLLNEIFSRYSYFAMQQQAEPIWTRIQAYMDVNLARTDVTDELMRRSSAAYPMIPMEEPGKKFVGTPLLREDDAELQKLAAILQHSPDYLTLDEVNAWLTQTGYAHAASEEEARIAAQLAIYSVVMELAPADWALDTPQQGQSALSGQYPNLRSLLTHYLANASTAAPSMVMQLNVNHAQWQGPELFGPVSLEVDNATPEYAQAVFYIEVLSDDSAFLYPPRITDATGKALASLRLGQPFYLHAPGADNWIDEMGEFELRAHSDRPLPYRDALLLLSLGNNLDDLQLALTARQFTGMVHFSLVDILYKEMDK